MSKVIEMEVASFRKIPNPYTEDGAEISQMYTAICDVTKVPEALLEWMETNPRKQNLNSKVGKKIKESLLTGDKNFHFLNRGILISAADVKFNNYDNKMRLVFEQSEYHGDVDGGHTLRVIMENQDSLSEGQQFVKIEILTGVESFFEDLAEARNTSTQVKDESIANLRDFFDIVQSALSGEPYAERINYMENDDGDIDVSEILAVLNMFNIDQYKSGQEGMDSNPSISYSSKKKCVDTYINLRRQVEEGTLDIENNPYYKMRNIVPEIFRLYDTIDSKMGAFYTRKNPGGHYGSTSGVTVAKDDSYFETKFLGTQTKHSNPKGFLYPILGAFRALVKEENGIYVWKKNPFDVLEKVGPELVNTTVERSRNNGNNPNKTGKDVTLWPSLYMRVMVEALSEN